MRRLGITTMLAIMALASSGPAQAVPPGFTIEFDGNGEGKVTFTGARHTGPGMHCSNCHICAPTIFLVPHINAKVPISVLYGVGGGVCQAIQCSVSISSRFLA